MSLRATPEQIFGSRLRVDPTTQQLQIPEYTLAIEPNTVFIILGLVAVVGLIGLFALAISGNQKCR